MYRHLLVPIDDTDLAIDTVGRAVEFARTMDARITFFHAQPEHAASLSGLTDPAELTYFGEGRTRELLAKAESAARAQGVPCDAASAVSDTPSQAILDAAKEKGCDLIFMASHGEGGSLGKMISSQTLQVLMHSEFPVLVSSAGRPSVAIQAIGVIRAEHRSLAAVLHAWLYLIQNAEECGTTPDHAQMQTMVRYIQAFPMALHHPKEEGYLFSKLRERTSALNAELDELERQHQRDAHLVAELAEAVSQFEGSELTLDELKKAVSQYAKFTWEHLGREEGVVLPAAQRYLTEADWHEINDAFTGNQDPRFGGDTEADLKQLFSRIVNLAQPKHD